MQLTMEECEKKITEAQQSIAQLNQQIPEIQANLMKLYGYKQALTEIEEEKNQKGDVDDKGKKAS